MTFRRVAGLLQHGKMPQIRHGLFDTTLLPDVLSDLAAEEWRLLAEIARVAGSSAHFEEAFFAFADLAAGLLDFDRVSINTVDGARETLTHRYVRGLTPPEYDQGVTRPVAESLAARPISTCDVLIVGDAVREEFGRQIPALKPIIDVGIRSIVTAPLDSRGEAVGSIFFGSVRPDAYGPRDAALTRVIASQIAGAVANVLGQELLGVKEAELAARAEEQAVLAKLGRITNSSLDFRLIFDELAPEIAGLVPAGHIALTLIDRNQGTLLVACTWGEKVPGRAQGAVVPLEGSLTEKVAGQGTGIVLEAGGENSELLYRTAGLREPLASGFDSLIAVPIISQAGVIGTLQCARRRLSAAYYTKEHLCLAEAIGAQISGAVTNSRLHAEIENQARDREALAEIGRIVSSSIDTDAIYPEFAVQARRLVHFDHISVGALGPGTDTLLEVFSAAGDASVLPSGGRLVLDGSPAATVLQSREPLALDGPPDAAPSGGPAANGDADPDGESSLIVPLIWHDDAVGVLSFLAGDGRAYGPAEVEKALQIAAEIAGAVGTARLYAEVKREGEIRERLAAIGLASQDLDLERAMSRVAFEVSRLFQYDRLVFTLPAEDGAAMRIAFACGLVIPNHGPGDPILDVFKQALADDDQWQWRSHRADSVIGSSGLRSWIWAPMGSRASGPIGYLGLASFDEDRFEEPELDLLQRVADQIVPAIQNAQAHRQALRLAEERERAAELEARARELQRTNEVKSRFLETVTHELKTPLTSMSAFTDVLSRNREGNLSEKQLSGLNVVKRNAHRLSVLIDDLVDVSRIDRGKLELHYSEFDALAIFTDLSESLSVLFEAKRQRLASHVPGHRLWMNADADRLSQVVTNLLSNASKYSGEGTVISLNVETVGDRLNVTVTDQGIGISEADAEKLFTPFYRVDSVEVRSVPGTGLGLAVASSIVKLHGGELTVASAPGEGSTFSVSLPGLMDGPSAEYLERLESQDAPGRPLTRFEEMDVAAGKAGEEAA